MAQASLNARARSPAEAEMSAVKPELDELFISYKRERRDQIEVLDAALRAWGFLSWWDRDLPVGKDFEATLYEQIDRARLVVVCLCELSVRSDSWVSNEIRKALEHDKIFPIIIQKGITLPPVLIEKKINCATLDCWDGMPESDLMLDVVLQLKQRAKTVKSEQAIDGQLKRLHKRYRANKPVGWPLSESVSDQSRSASDAPALLQRIGGGKRWRSHPLLPEFVDVPAGSVVCGAQDQERILGSAAFDWSPCTVSIDRSFAVGCWPVSIGQYNLQFDRAFNDKWGRHAREGEPIAENEDPKLPVTDVSWFEAKAYAAWLAELTGEPYRLLSEAEWEYACRAGSAESALFSWGSEINPSLANYNWSREFNSGLVKKAHVPQVLPIERTSSVHENRFGLCDMLGNVWEWVEDSFSRQMQAPTGTWHAFADPRSNQAVIRGGSFQCPPEHLRCAHRRPWSKEPGAPHIGFRVARGLRSD